MRYNNYSISKDVKRKVERCYSAYWKRHLVRTPFIKYLHNLHLLKEISEFTV